MLRWKIALLLLFCGNAWADHDELEATLDVPFRVQPGAAHVFTLDLSNPHAGEIAAVHWSVEVRSPAGTVVKRWSGDERMFRRALRRRLSWSSGRRPAGLYTVVLRAGDLEQSWPLAVGPVPAVRLPASALAPPALPYRIVYGNLHSQTNHSDGGGDLATCKGAQEPQSGRFNPSDAYAYALLRGLDFLMASEHNHMYDGSDGKNLDADPAQARALYQDGLAQAARFSAANPAFVALYGLEWGVIEGGGHLNIFNSPALLEWEVNREGALIGDVATPRGDYAALYTLMRTQGWIGQFNHPAPNGQFAVDGKALGYHPDGDQVMVLCEVLNSAAFSAREDEGETRRSSFEGACNKLLEAGYHLAFSSDQDNHCANWGASYSNRTGILIPNGVAFDRASLLDALRARRVFATMDKKSSIVLSANRHIMGERFVNRGALALDVRYASAAGRQVAAVALFEGVPGRNGSVTQLASAMQARVTPAVGEHFYYARIIQDDGKMLWSAPVWVTQEAD